MAYYSKIAQDAPVYVTYSNIVSDENVDRHFWISDGHYLVDEAREVHSVVSTGAKTGQLKKMASGEAVTTQGTNLLATDIDFALSANVPRSASLVISETTRTVSPGERLAVLFAGAGTGLTGVVISIRLKRVRPLP